MRRAAFLLPIALAACEAALPAPSTVVIANDAPAASASVAPRVEPVALPPPPPELDLPGPAACTLPTSGDYELRFRPGAPPFASSNGASANVEVPVGGPAVGAVLRASRDGFSLQGIVAASDLWMVPARAMVLAGFVVPGPGAAFTWKGTAPGTVTVGFALGAEVEVLPEARLDDSTLKCDAVSLRVMDFDASTAAPRGAKEREARLAVGRAVPIARTPDGAPVARFRASKEDVYVTVVETRGRRLLVRRELPDAIVFGWVAASDLRPPPKDVIGEKYGTGGLGLRGVGEGGGERRRLRCDRIVPLVAEIAGERRTVGSIAAGTTMELAEKHGDLVDVVLPAVFSALAGAHVGALVSHVEGCAAVR